ncbi:CDP-glycerol glycerophosphotransferase family protein [Bacillus paralicheniformis]|uniref:CDP-glycerol glycerophosphotransferase family protein n=1 Tax=Bacillus paralicheniformis TaxID=1648923 RepID=UPI0021086687|nr:CDP-glycerol glycerophosphotransferase family protein [Bacillus paralicheniformis]MCQ5454261.1 CDP-glycerol glycerophosphotransferase family protein [Bacillus paralicheniformis]
MNKKILKRKVKFIKDPLENYLKKTNHRRNNQYAKFYEKLNVIDNTILYESRDGKSITDSPFAIFKYLTKNPEFKHYKHIWSVEDFHALEPVISKYKDMPNVEFVKRNSTQYLKYLASVKYLINNSTFQSFFTCKKEQVYINTWHGTPLKSMGFDIPGNPAHSQNVVRNFISTDYLLSPNKHTTNMFVNSYKLKGLYTGEIIEEGYPRIDLTLNTVPENFKKFLKELDLQIETEKKTILYAPTWKGTSVSKVKNDVFQIVADMNYLEDKIGAEYNILIKVHPFLYSTAVKSEELKGKLVPDFVDTNQLLSTIDILLTDYSSIFFDFLVTNRPILFYMWDADDYNEQRGKYIKNEDLPGPVLYNVRELTEAIEDINKVSSEFEKKYQESKAKFTNYDDGNVTKRVVDKIFKNSGQVNVIKDLNKGKEKILIYPGGMKNNGITTSFINLMSNIDFEKYDVSCFMATPHQKEVLNNIDKVNKNVRFIFKPGLPVYTLSEVYKDKLIHNRGAKGRLKELYPNDAYVREHQRLFGKSKFDYVIDFSGYSLYWAKFLVCADAKKKICYMHNDLLSDSERLVNGRRPHRINLRGLFSIYNKFDKLVSVSKGTMELNKKNLSIYADEDHFDYIMNSINPERILGIEHTESDSATSVNPHENGSKNHVDIVDNKRFKARAKIVNADGFFVVNTLIDKANTRLTPAKEFENEEVLILREAHTNDGRILYKLSINGSTIGWLEEGALEILPDSILTEKEVNRLAIIQHPKGNDIWNKPYKVLDVEKVSSSKEYKGIIVAVDKEVRTQHSFYSRIYINDVLIGWIDSSALKIVKEYELDSECADEQQSIINKEKNKIKQKNYKKHSDIIQGLDNRTLEEKALNLLAKITSGEDYMIWSKAYPNNGCQKISTAEEFNGLIAKVIKSHKTKEGTYYLFSIDEKVIGWLDCNAFKTIDETVIIEEKPVEYEAQINLGDTEYIFNKPYDVKGCSIIDDYKKFNHEEVKVVEEATTQHGTYCKVIYHDRELGWIERNALEKIEPLGLKVGKTLIPYPSESDFNFVNMGRLSPEKAQDNLIKAFHTHVQTYPNSKLYILGEGPLKKDLQQLITDLDLEEHAYLVGQLDNPFGFLKMCDCFVLSSHYEGQPMVLLEAMTLGMKILATDIVANRTVLENGKYGTLVEDSVTGLEQGLVKVRTEPVDSSQSFDYIEYNKTAMNSFYKVLS